jgi:hypothetical protein
MIESLFQAGLNDAIIIQHELSFVSFNERKDAGNHYILRFHFVRTLLD